MKKILCPIDFSDTADRALATAAKLAQECDAQLELLNIHSIHEMTPSELLLGTAMKVATNSSRLEELSNEISRAYKISCYGNAQSSSRSLPQVIVEAENGFDLVVMGTNGSDETFDALFGTNSYQVAKESSVPVLLLPPAYDYEGFSNMVFAMDYFHQLTSPPEQLMKWADLFDAKITVLQIMTEEYRHRHDEKLNEAQVTLKGFLDEKHHNFKTIYSNRPVEGILDYIKVNECDVLALCFRHHSLIQQLFLKNVVKNLCALTPCPLFIFHQ